MKRFVNKNCQVEELTYQQGFIALTSVIFISAVLLILTATLSASAYSLRFNVQDYENKKISSALAEACTKTALIKLAQNSDYSGDELITVEPGRLCKICGIAMGQPKSILTRAVQNGAYTNLLVVGSMSTENFAVSSWQEQAGYIGSCSVP